MLTMQSYAASRSSTSSKVRIAPVDNPTVIFAAPDISRLLTSLAGVPHWLTSVRCTAPNPT